ncbi:MAG: hypothetical protein DRJ40_00895 [Thermoprotei archaeon]|nr:MAG: hypothetical protein DRJ40_00895 [Thermoprotei archaeon]
MLTEREQELKYWPVILLLPCRREYWINVLSTIFRSKVAIDILLNMDMHDKTYQKDLIRKLRGHSNKTIIRYLRMFVEEGILEEGIEKIKTGEKYVWVKWYRLTPIGKSVALLLKSIRGIEPEELKKIVLELLEIYAMSLARLCKYISLNPDELREVFSRTLEKYIR